MSLVQAYIYRDFIVVAGEQRAKLNNGEILENFVKVRKISDTAIIGMTGTIEGNAKLFSEFINSDFSLRGDFSCVSYNDICKSLCKSYYDNYDYLQVHNVHSVLCGWDGVKMTGKAFFTKDDNPNKNGIHDLTPQDAETVRVVSCGLNVHYNNAIEFGKSVSIINITQMKNIFKNVLQIGIKLDDSINNKATFERIRKVDVI
ncbi:MAG: hypothetical protein E7264_07695 [Lachnospiraceae bacterium]|nr:hypothetical protein [Lachnospiraceae bacterium]